MLYGTSIHSKYILYNRSKLYVERMRNSIPSFVSDAESEMKEYITSIKGYASSGEINYLTFTLLTTWDNLLPQLYKSQRNIKALVVSRFDYFHALSMKSQIEFYFSSFLTTSLYEDDELYLDKIENSDYDLIITDFSLPKNFKKRWLYLHGSRTLNDYKGMIDLIHDISNKKSSY